MDGRGRAILSDTRIIVTDFDLNAIGDDWSALVNAGIAVADAHDRNRWTLGDLGVKVERRYKSDSLGKFATEINIRPNTMYDYVSCSTFFDKERREAFPSLNWSHYRASMKAGDLTSALEWLTKASDGNWTVEALAAAIKVAAGGDPKPEKLVAVGGQFTDLHPRVSGYGEIVGYEITFQIAPEAGEAITEALAVGGAYTLKIYGIKKEESADETEE